MNGTTETQGGNGNSALTVEEQKICQALGVSKEDYIKAKLEEEALKTGSGTGNASGINLNQSGGRALNADERKICQALGISEEDYLKTRSEEEALNAGSAAGNTSLNWRRAVGGDKAINSDDKKIFVPSVVSRPELLKAII